MNLKKLISLIFEENLPGTAIILGRFQPITIAHYNIINEARKKYQSTFVVIVSGKSRKNNPFSVSERAKLIFQAFEGKLPMSHIIKAETGFTPDVIRKIESLISKQKNKKKFIIFAGTDRIEDYRRQIQNYYKGDADVEVIEIPREEDSISATKVRKALIDDDIDNYKRLMPTSLWDKFKNLRKILLQRKNYLTDENNL